MLNTELKSGLTPPKLGLTIDWEPDVFDKFPKAMASLDAFSCPVTSAEYIAWPFFTVEANGEKGSRREARLRNLHNGAVMLSNIYALKQRCKRFSKGKHWLQLLTYLALSTMHSPVCLQFIIPCIIATTRSAGYYECRARYFP